MAGNPFYKSGFWLKLRDVAIQRARGRCEVEGCGRRAVVVDHIQTRPRGEEGPTAWDRLGNLRVLCREHDNQIKEGRDGKRARGGETFVSTFGPDGISLDPRHPSFQSAWEDDPEFEAACRAAGLEDTACAADVGVE